MDFHVYEPGISATKLKQRRTPGSGTHDHEVLQSDVIRAKCKRVDSPGASREDGPVAPKPNPNDGRTRFRGKGRGDGFSMAGHEDNHIPNAGRAQGNALGQSRHGMGLVQPCVAVTPARRTDKNIRASR